MSLALWNDIMEMCYDDALYTSDEELEESHNETAAGIIEDWVVLSKY
ncbi:MAG TPA: hypothetical protein VJ824_07190 [Bacillota bacterium]|nr:hypothetical protein [Bacillota bacterium]